MTDIEALKERREFWENRAWELDKNMKKANRWIWMLMRSNPYLLNLEDYVLNWENDIDYEGSTFNETQLWDGTIRFEEPEEIFFETEEHLIRCYRRELWDTNKLTGEVKHIGEGY